MRFEGVTRLCEGMSDAPPRYRFDDFVLDPVSRALEHRERPCALTIKAFDTLLLLVQCAGEVVSKETLLGTVWAGVSVDENNVSQAISTIRKALDDTATPRRFILTIPGEGYRFLRPVTIEPRGRREGTEPVAVERVALEPVAVDSIAIGPISVEQDIVLPEPTLDELTQAAGLGGGRKTAMLVPLTGALIVAIAVIAWALGAFRSPAQAVRGAELAHAIPLTSEPGDESWPAFSPDDTRLAFSWRKTDQDDARIAVKIIGGDGPMLVTDVTGFRPVWSPDGNFIAFQRGVREPVPAMHICLMPADGGAPRVLYTQPHQTPPGLAWWEGGNALVFSTRATPDQPFHLAALDLTTLRVHALTTPPPAPLVSAGDSQPAIAPDRRTLAFVRETQDGMDVFVQNLVTREERRLTYERQKIWGLAWASDGRSLIISSTRHGVATLYRLTLADGQLARVPYVEQDAVQPAVSHRGERLAFRYDYADSNVYRVDLRQGVATGPPRRIIASSRLDDSPRISPDGRQIAFESSRSGATEIWIADADGSHPRQVTFLQGVAVNPAWSPDGTHLAFEGRADATATNTIREDVWVVDARGGTPRPVTTDPSFDGVPAWSADGESIYFLSERQDGWQIWNVSARGGAATRVTSHGGLRAQASRDGSTLYYVTDEPAIWQRAIASGSGEDALVMTLPRDTLWGGDWFVGRRGLYVLGAPQPVGGPAIELMPFRHPATPSLVTATRSRSRSVPARLIVASMTAPASTRTSFSVAPDDSWLVWSQRDYHNRDIVLLDPPR